MKIPDLVWRGARACRRHPPRAYSAQPSTGRMGRSRFGKLAALLAIAAAVVLGGLGTSTQAQAYATLGHPLPSARYQPPAAAAHPLPPAGYQPPVAAGRVDPSRIPGVRVHKVRLPAAECHAWNRAHPGAAPNCRAINYSWGVNHQPLPAGTRMAGDAKSANASSGYWYWSQWDENCAVVGCWYASVSLQEDGVADGYYVWQWNEYCNPSGYVTVTWCGYSNNGGYGYPMTFGSDSSACVSGFCYANGQRREIDPWGNPVAYWSW